MRGFYYIYRLHCRRKEYSVDDMSHSIRRDNISRFYHSWSIDHELSVYFRELESLSFYSCKCESIGQVSRSILSSHHMICKDIYESCLILRLHECLYSSSRKLRKCWVCRSKYCEWSCRLECIYESSSFHCSNHSSYIICEDSIVYDISRLDHHSTTYHNSTICSIHREEILLDDEILRKGTAITHDSSSLRKTITISSPVISILLCYAYYGHTIERNRRLHHHRMRIHHRIRFHHHRTIRHLHGCPHICIHHRLHGEDRRGESHSS